ncbi:SKP1-like protein 1B [Sesamum alatum]|uniref:SKP1-like protein n=1 Tax=Sesamum alatum TaxID=300844 RepID=A0AAE1YIM1_9LAMI|nr:SKP1-like protein 1B [Sesamum alatum]
MARKNRNPVGKNVDPEAQKKKTRTLTLKSSDGQEFSISESAAVLSIAIENMVEDDCAGGVIPLPLVDGGTLARVITYLNKHAEDGASDEEKRKFDEEFVSGMEMGVLFDVVLAANYLDIRGLLREVRRRIADRMKNKSVEWVRKTFHIESDFTPEEEEQMKKEFAWAWEGVDSDVDD